MAWVPGRQRRDCPLSKLKLILNKITEEKFLPISLEIRTLFEEKIYIDRLMQGGAEAILEKGIRENGYAALYAQLCNYLCEERIAFKPIVLNTLQTIFREILHLDITSATRAKRLIGCICVISEFYNTNLLPSKILFNDVAARLLLEKTDQSLEALCILFARVWSKVCEYKPTKASLQDYLRALAVIQKDINVNITSRTRFLMLDIIEKAIA